MIRPTGSRVVVKKPTRQERTDSGIILPDTAKDAPQTGEVLAVGDGGHRPNGTPYKMSVQVGDEVLFPKFTGTEINVDGEDVLIMPEHDILAVMEDK